MKQCALHVLWVDFELRSTILLCVVSLQGKQQQQQKQGGDNGGAAATAAEESAVQESINY